MTTPPAPVAMSTSDRRISIFIVLVIIAVLAGGLGAALHLPPPLPKVDWWLADGFPTGPTFDPSQVQTMTEVPIDVAELECSSPRYASLAPSMLATPEVRYTRTSVIITVRFNDPTGALNACVNNDPSHVSQLLDVGWPVEVHLDSPLGGRTLLDGSTDPPHTPGQY